MNPDLERLISLQRIDSTIGDDERRLAEEPDRQRALDARIDEAKGRVSVARERLTQSQTSRRDVEKELAVHQGRLSKFRDQLMSVKTNVEYQAMQKEIEFAQHEVKMLEDKILEFMLEADDLNAAVKSTEGELAKDTKTVEGDRKTLAADIANIRHELEELRGERSTLVAAISPQVLGMFELVSRRRHGIAIAEARAGICTICHVRLRPQVFNDVRRNDQIIQCDSCNRILYFVPGAAATEATQTTTP